jgi:hypothetical protein
MTINTLAAAKFPPPHNLFTLSSPPFLKGLTIAVEDVKMPNPKYRI